MFKPWFSALLCLAALLPGCKPEAPVAPAVQTHADVVDPRGGALSDAAIPLPASEPPAPVAERATDWRPLELTSGKLRISCEHDYEAEGDGTALSSLGYSALRAALAPCAEAGLVRLRYDGKISSDFTALIERSVEMADTLGIGKRILDLDSSGGQIEEAIRVGDIIGESGWTLWIREDSVCHSSCVLVLAAGDMRMIAGKVGIHRMVRIGSTATSRAELQQELQDVHAQVREYLQRNGVAYAVADLMMTVPNRELRVLSENELDFFGLSGQNAVADDLQRIRLARKCGESFVRRKDAFFRAFDRECRVEESDLGAMGECGTVLRKRFGFPDQGCPAESPLSEYDSPLVAGGGQGDGERS